ncbi:hypothetical protein ACS8FB_07720 [Psychrobacter sp. 1U1]|uniref:hypothetical protein n=2 Tax=unclassified Psychrobacter TaxID=196806 RepID=UPI003F48C230
MYDSTAVQLPTNLRIDTAIKYGSRLRTLMYTGLSISIVLLSWLAKLSWWQHALILIVSAAVIGYLALSRPILLHLSQPPLHNHLNKEWQLLMRTGRNDELWRADLNNVHRYQWLLNFQFVTTEPFKRSLTITIYRDQVSLDHWQQLNILATIVNKKHG